MTNKCGEMQVFLAKLALGRWWLFRFLDSPPVVLFGYCSQAHLWDIVNILLQVPMTLLGVLLMDKSGRRVLLMVCRKLCSSFQALLYEKSKRVFFVYRFLQQEHAWVASWSDYHTCCRFLLRRTCFYIYQLIICR